MAFPLSRRTVLAAFGLAPAAAAQTGGSDAIDNFIERRLQEAGIPGAGVAVVREGRVVKSAGYGHISLELRQPLTVDTVQPMASASKMIAGLIAGRLVEQGRLDLDAPVTRYLPEMAPARSEVRIRHMLSHTSGLNGLSANPEFGAERQRREQRQALVGERKLDYFTDEELLAYGARLDPASAPGARWAYSQYPFFLFGVIVARLTGTAYPEAAQDLVFGPLGLTTTRYGDHRVLIPGKHPTSYTREFGPLQHIALRYSPGFWPAAGLNISAADMARLLLGFEPGRLLRRETLARLWQRTPLSDGGRADYGLAFTVGAADGRTWVGHEGGGCCYVGWWPEQRLGIGIQLNLSGARQDGIERALAAAILA